MRIILLILFLPLLTTAYNLDVIKPTIYKEGSKINQGRQTSGSFFGYTVLLSVQKEVLSNGSSLHKPWMFVGAPKANYARQLGHENNKIAMEPGISYRCPLPKDCVPIKVTNPDDEIGFIEQVQLKTLIEKEYAWFGAAMSLHQPSDLLTVCAPRTVVRIYSSLAADYQNTMQGACYDGKLYSGNLEMDDKNFSTYDFHSTFWYNPLNGFSVHYLKPQAKMLADSNYPIIGSPKHEVFGSVHKQGKQKTVELPIGDDLSQFGYALTSGNYFNAEQLLVAAAAPGWKYVGQVAMMDPRADPLSITLTINGKEVGEYFGASLATGDVNKDGLDDLIVGAPHGNNGNGRVHIFLGNKAGEFFEADILLEGRVEDGQYGYAVTSGDLDDDGFDDLIIGAPWEGHGVIYVYNGDAKLQELHSLEHSQRIEASQIDSNIRGFGFSFSKPVDVDANNFLDVAVGAYASGHAVLLRSRAAVRTELTLSTFPKTLPRTSTNFYLSVCVNHYPHNTYESRLWDRKLILIVDEDYKRIKTYYERKSYVGGDRGHCWNQTLHLQNNIRNYVDVIEIVVIHEFWYWDDHNLEFNGFLCPIDYKLRNATARTKLSFDIGCGMDEICHASIFTKLEFEGARNSTWIIGSDDLRLVLRIGNHAEPAYLTTVTFHVPEGIYLRSIFPTCQEEGNSKALRVTCDVGNPLGKGAEEKISLDLDMNGMRNGSANGTVLIFLAEVKTRSVNLEPSVISIPLHLKANLSVALSGKAHDNSYYFEHNEKPTNFTFQHSYQISRFGETPISEAVLTVQVPYQLYGLEFLTLERKPRVSLLDRFYECSVIGVSVMKPHFLDESLTEPGMENDFHLDTAANLSRSRRATTQDDLPAVPRMDTISRTMLTDSTEWKSDDNAQALFYTMSKSEYVDIVYLNCSAPNVTCGAVVCKIPSLKTDRDVVKLQLQLVVNDSTLAGGPEDKAKAVDITTEASVQVLDPKLESIFPGAGIAVPVTTTFHHAPNVRNDISIWIILGSILLGLLALSLIGLGLWKVGFFKRNKKDELERLKKNEHLPMLADSLSEDQNNVFI